MSFEDIPAQKNGYKLDMTQPKSQSCNPSARPCCWYGLSKAAWSGCDESTNGARSGCNRPVCNATAATTICTWYKTPHTEEWEKDNSYYRLLKKEELIRVFSVTPTSLTAPAPILPLVNTISNILPSSKLLLLSHLYPHLLKKRIRFEKISPQDINICRNKKTIHI